MISRRQAGPETTTERSGPDVYKNIRHPLASLKETLKGQASGLFLGGIAWAMWAEPATIDLLTPISVAYAAWVLTRRVTLPLRLPKSSGRLDHGHPDPKAQHAPGGRLVYNPRLASGIIFLGWEQATGCELWIGNEDARQHVAIAGTTGSGKSDTLLSLMANSLIHSSGFVFVDGKASNELYAKTYCLARRFGREDDVLAFNLLAQGKEHTNTRNPFRTGTADMIRELLATLIGETRADDQNGIFKARAISLLSGLIPILTWMRDNKGVLLTIDRIRFAMELRNVVMTAVDRQFPVFDINTGVITIIPIHDISEAMLYPLRAYLGETGGYDVQRPFDEQESGKPSEQHSYCRMYFSHAFTQLGVTLGHIFNVETGDIDMRDVLLNRRIFIVNLPALENSDSTNAALGKLVVADLRNMMAQTLGAALEGDVAEIIENKPTTAPTPFPIVFDELAPYACESMDSMLAMGRGLGFQFFLSFQETAGLRARLGDRMYSLLGNANLQILMKLQDGGETRRYVEQTAGDSFVTQMSSYQQQSGMTYQEARHAEVRRTSRVDWLDLRKQIEGEAVILFGDRRVYAKLFHAGLKPSGEIRLNRPIMLLPPDPEDIRDDANRVDHVREAIRSGALAEPSTEPVSPQLSNMLEVFQRHLANGISTENAAEAAIVSCTEDEDLIAKPALGISGGDLAEAPETEFSAMLEEYIQVPGKPARESEFLTARETNDPIFRDLVAIEQALGSDTITARKAALTAFSDLSSGQVSPVLAGPVDIDALRHHLEELIETLAKIQG